jgi:hypothetical protein
MLERCRFGYYSSEKGVRVVITHEKKEWGWQKVDQQWE